MADEIEDGEVTLADSKKPDAKAEYWLNWITLAKKAAKNHHESAREAWRLYLGERAKTANQQLPRSPRVYRFPAFWAAINTMQPIFYSQKPTVIVEADFAAYDPVANTAATALERLARQLMKQNPVDTVFARTRDDGLLADKGTNRVLFDEENYETEQIFVNQIQLEDGTTVWADAGEDIVPDGTPILQNEQGAYFYEKPVFEGCAKLLPVSIFDVLHTPYARDWTEIKEMAFRLHLSKRDVEEMFGKEIAAQIPYKSRRSNDEDDVEPRRDRKIKDTAEIWEIWDKRSKKVFYICDGFPHLLKPLDAESAEVDDPYGLCQFFPCPPFFIGTCPPDNMFPIPMSEQVRDILQAINESFKRFFKTIRSTRRRGIFNANIPELGQLETDLDEGEFIGVTSWEKLVGDGGKMQDVVYNFPVGELVQAAQEMVAGLQTLKAWFDEALGVSDIMRGATDPIETATAQKIKQRNASLRTSWKQRQFQDLVACSLRLLSELAIKQLPEQQLNTMIGARFMSAEDQQRLPTAWALLRTDRWRSIRLTIETDSTILADEEADAEKKAALVTAVTQGLAQFNQDIPAPLQRVLGKLVVYGLEGQRDAKVIIDDMRGAIEEMQQPQEPPPPPPDYEAQKIQIKQFEIQTNAQIETQKLNLDAQKAITQAEIEREKLQLEAQKIGAEAGIKQMRIELDRQIAQVSQTQKQIETELNAQRAALDIQERMLTEQRLQREEALEAQRTAAMAMQAAQPQQPPTIVIEAPKPTKKKYKIVRDALGNAQVETEEAPS